MDNSLPCSQVSLSKPQGLYMLSLVCRTSTRIILCLVCLDYKQITAFSLKPMPKYSLLHLKATAFPVVASYWIFNSLTGLKASSLQPGREAATDICHGPCEVKEKSGYTAPNLIPASVRPEQSHYAITNTRSYLTTAFQHSLPVSSVTVITLMQFSNNSDWV